MNPVLEYVVHIVRLYMQEPYASLVLGVTYGIPVRITPQLSEQIVRSGLSHMIVLSGANITVLLFVVESFYSTIGKRLGLIGYGLCILYFVSVVGLQPPLFRAACMFILSTVCVLTGRPSYPLWNLWLTIFFVALWRPNWIYSRSFLLSVVATIGVFVGSAFTKAFVVHASTFVSEFIVSIFVFLFTLPTSVFFFRSISLIGPLATVISGMFIGPIMIGGILIPLAHIVLPEGASLIALPVQALSASLLLCIEYFSSIPHMFIAW